MSAALWVRAQRSRDMQVLRPPSERCAHRGGRSAHHPWAQYRLPATQPLASFIPPPPPYIYPTARSAMPWDVNWRNFSKSGRYRVVWVQKFFFVQIHFFWSPEWKKSVLEKKSFRTAPSPGGPLEIFLSPAAIGPPHIAPWTPTGTTEGPLYGGWSYTWCR